MFSPSCMLVQFFFLERDKYVAEWWIMYQRTKASKKAKVLFSDSKTGAGWQGDLSAQEMNYDSDLEVSNAHLHSAYQKELFWQFGWVEGWHWYRSSLRRKAPEATESDLALLLRFWALILTERTTARAGPRYVFALPWSISYHLSEGIALRVWLPGNFWCQFWCRRITGICAHCANTHQHTLMLLLFVCVGQVMLNSLQNAFVRMWLIWREQNLVWIYHLINNHYRAPLSKILSSTSDYTNKTWNCTVFSEIFTSGLRRG